MAAHATSKGRNKRSKVKRKYSKTREDAQLCGVIPTTPEGAVRDERVDPATQEEQDIPDIDRMAMSQGWSVPERAKRQVVNKLLEPFYEVNTVIDPTGREVVVPPDRNLLKENAKVLLAADKNQWERDNPTEAGKARGSVSVQNNVQVNLFEVVAQAAQVDRPDEVEQKIMSVEVGDDAGRT